MAKVSLPQGTRDFSSNTLRKRNFVFNTIRTVFELYGFQPLETPAIENVDTLLGKYGEEGDKLIFKILNNGLDNPAKHTQVAADFEKVLAGKTTPAITERALRYDLTIPFARYVAMNYGQLTLPFKRYQIQPVWRADRPQKGRYREFYQCDADVVGSNSLLNEVELTSIYSEVFRRLGIDVEIKLNNRKVLAALAEICGEADMMNITVAIDKLDKIGLDKVKVELLQRGLNEEQVIVIENYLSISGNNNERLGKLNDLIGNTRIGKQGIEELHYVLNFLPSSICEQLTADFTLARGLNYYTGTIFEIKAKGIQIGSIGGGGRYDDLTGLFGVPNVPGVGISFGVDRIFDVMEELNLFGEDVGSNSRILFFNLGENESREAFKLMQRARANGIACEIYPEHVKFDKQFKYAVKKAIPFVVIIGSKELEENSYLLKNLVTGEQKTHSIEDLVEVKFQ